MRHALRASAVLTLFFVSSRVHKTHTRNRSALARASAGTSEPCVCVHQLDAEEMPSGPDQPRKPVFGALLQMKSAQEASVRVGLSRSTASPPIPARR